jgi:hypothetical protein
MDERIGNLGGAVYVKNAPGGGFSLNVSVPFKSEEEQTGGDFRNGR